MAGYLLHLGVKVMCSHGGQANPGGASARVMLSGQPAVSLTHAYSIAACPFTTPEPAPKPCVTLQWTTPATRVLVEGAPAILSTSSGLTIGPMGPQGSPQVAAQQMRVQGS
jgi:hypothetical protein